MVYEIYLEPRPASLVSTSVVETVHPRYLVVLIG